jgi:hypothetical protein
MLSKKEKRKEKKRKEKKREEISPKTWIAAYRMICPSILIFPVGNAQSK